MESGGGMMKRRGFLELAATLPVTAGIVMPSAITAVSTPSPASAAEPGWPAEFPEFKHYPSAREVDAWIEEIWRRTEKIECKVEMTNNKAFTYAYAVQHFRANQYVKFTPGDPDHCPFYGFWQPCINGPAPLLVHVPG